MNTHNKVFIEIGTSSTCHVLPSSTALSAIVTPLLPVPSAQAIAHKYLP